MCARNVRERTFCAPVMNVSLRFACVGFFQIDALPSSSNVPSPTPSGWCSLCSIRLVVASSSQNVAWTSCVPPVMPKRRHIGVLGGRSGDAVAQHGVVGMRCGLLHEVGHDLGHRAAGERGAPAGGAVALDQDPFDLL